MITVTGLKNFDKERNSILNDAVSLINICSSDTGHLADIVCCLGAIISSLELKANALSETFLKQKEEQK